MATRTRTALIAGATGASAKRRVEVLLDGPQWSLIGLSRHPPAERPSPRLTFIGADLADAAQSKRALARCTGATHVFYTARATHGESGHESVEDNVATLRNLLDAARSRCARARASGRRRQYYGIHRGPYPTPAVEDDPRPASPNFYYGQEDLLRDRQRGQRWSWSASRPNVICDFALNGRAIWCRSSAHMRPSCASSGCRCTFPASRVAGRH